MNKIEIFINNHQEKYYFFGFISLIGTFLMMLIGSTIDPKGTFLEHIPGVSFGIMFVGLLLIHEFILIKYKNIFDIDSFAQFGVLNGVSFILTVCISTFTFMIINIIVLAIKELIDNFLSVLMVLKDIGVVLLVIGGVILFKYLVYKWLVKKK